jgi:hypothetical protein
MRKLAGILITAATAISMLTLGAAPALAAPPVSTGCYLYNNGSGAEIELDQDLGQGGNDVMDHYRVVIDGTPHTVTFARTYNSLIVLLFSQNITTSTQTASLSHQRTTSGGLANLSSQFISNFTCTLDLDDLGPTVQSATTNSAGTQIIATTTGAIDANDSFVRDASNWAVSNNGTQISVSSVAVVGTTITLALSSVLGHGESADVSFFGGPEETSQSRMGSIPDFWLSRDQALIVNSLTPAPIQNPTPVAPVSEPSSPAIITGSSAPSVAQGESLNLLGTNLSGVTSLKVGAVDLEILTRSDQEITVRIPASMPTGSKDLIVVTAAGQTTSTKLFTVVEVGPSIVQAGFSSIKRTGNSVRMFVLNPQGLGKVQFKINGREIAWVRAVDETDPKIRVANDRSYFVRNSSLRSGKNAVEIFIDGTRVKRASYTR